MPGDVLGTDIETIYYIQSEGAFGRARSRGRVQVTKARLKSREPHLCSFHQVVGGLQSIHVVPCGLQEIPLKDIVGSVGREKEFSHGFCPLSSSARQKERWRISYTLSCVGRGYPPIEVCKVGRIYFVVNGHHRVSVAKYLGWRTIQAHVSELAQPTVIN